MWHIAIVSDRIELFMQKFPACTPFPINLITASQYAVRKTSLRDLKDNLMKSKIIVY